MFARVSRFCFRHRYLVVLIWVAALAGGVAASGPVFAALSRESDVRFESTDAFDVLREARPDGGTVVGVVDRVDPGAPGTRAAVTTSAAALRRESGVLRVDEPYSAGPAAAGLIAPDGRAVLVLVHLRKDLGDREDAVVDAAAARLRAIDDRVPGARVEVGGGALLDREINAQVQRDLSTAELVALPLTLLFMVVVFGGFLAAGVPVVGALASMGAAMLGLWGFSTFTTLDSNTITVVTLLGLGLSIDYGLLVLSRYREELARVAVAPSGVTVGPDRWGVGLIAREEAMARTGATAGRTVAFSALTVAAALGGLIVMGVPFMQALGAAGISIALVTMLSALTLVPALARIAGRRIRPAKRRAEHAGQGFFAGLARRVQHRPLLVLALTLTALALLAAPLLSARLTNPELDGIPRTLESKRVADTLDARFARHGEPAIVVVARTDPSALDTWAARHAGDRGVTSIEPAESVAPGLSTVDVHVAGDPRGGPARALVEAFRADRPDGGQSWVSGTAAFFTDQLALLRRDLPWALGVMVAAMLVLLFAMTGSVVVPLKALAMNLVSMGATFGVMVAAFQWGWGAGPLDLLVNAGLDPFVLVIIFAFAFGLSMDYETFLLARIKEAYDGGLPNDEAVRAGLQRSGRIITSAAVAMVIVFGAFVGGRIGTVEQIGLGLVVAVLVDATIVRCLLVPATMTLLGRANWWAPRPLRALHRRFGLREAAAAPAPVERELTAVG